MNLVNLTAQILIHRQNNSVGLDIFKILSETFLVGIRHFETDLISDFIVGTTAVDCCHDRFSGGHGPVDHIGNQVIRDTILLAEKLGIHQINTFSGCPGDHEGAKYSNWVTCPWPNEFGEILKWQWEEVLIPYWKKEAEFCASHGIKKIAFEMHPGFCVYNPETTLRLREAVGDIIGANVDPSHLFWQGMDPIAVIKELGRAGAIYHFHAKDTKIDSINTAVNGVLDNKGYGDIANRSWVFRTVGYGHGKETWNDIISTLRTVGYDGTVSIEHEDGLMSPKEGLEKAVRFLQDVLIKEQPAAMWWV